MLIHLLTEIHVSAWSAEKCYWQVIHGYIEVYIYIVNWYGFEQNKFQPVCILILSFFFVYIHLCKMNFEWTQKTLNFIIYLKTNDMCLLSPFGMFFFNFLYWYIYYHQDYYWNSDKWNVIILPECTCFKVYVTKSKFKQKFLRHSIWRLKVMYMVRFIKYS